MTGALASNNALERTAFILDHVTEFVDPNNLLDLLVGRFTGEGVMMLLV